MATTSGALAPGTAPAGHGGKHTGRWAAVLAAAALGLALLTGGLAGQGRQGDTAPAAVPAAQQPGTVLDWEQHERGQVAPALPGVTLDWEQVERAQVAPAQFVPPLDWEQQERTHVAP
jgi:hypothetical protein